LSGCAPDRTAAYESASIPSPTAIYAAAAERFDPMWTFISRYLYPPTPGLTYYDLCILPRPNPISKTTGV
jgi:hypothetical protein